MLVLQNIQAAYADPGFVDKVNSGLLKVTFLVDATGLDKIPIQDSNTDVKPKEQNSSIGLPLSTLLVVAVGSAALVVFVGSFYMWRRRQPGDRENDAARIAGSTSNGTSDDSHRPQSPYSEMVSGSYRLDRLTEMSILSSSNMSPVYELEEDADTAAAGSIVVSDGGYTTDAGLTDGGDSSSNFDGSKVSSQSTPKFLGARPFPGTVNMNMEEASDSDLDTSGEMSPVKMFLGEKPQLLLPSGGDHEEDHADDSLLFTPRTENGASDIESIDPQYTTAMASSF